MATYFFDSSGLVKRSIAETGSAWVQTLTDPQSGNLLYVARITGAELIAAITRRQRRGAATLAAAAAAVTAAAAAVTAAAAAVTAFRADFSRAYFPLDVTPALISQAMDLVERHGLRGYDSV